MPDLDMYKRKLNSYGNYLGEVRKTTADRAIDRSFTNDPNYKRVLVQVDEDTYLNTNATDRMYYDGYYFKKVDVKFQRHSRQSILADWVDYYIQFRPGVTVDIGLYVIIPDETTFEPDITDESNWWMIVLRNRTRQFPRYMVLQCNWMFKWIDQGKYYYQRGVIRNANSYTSGDWTGNDTTVIDNISSAWVPRNDDTETIHYDLRFIMNLNKNHPQVYKVTKIIDVVPKGIIKITLSQDFYDEIRDNAELGICDYYNVDKQITITDEPIGNTSDVYDIALYCKHNTISNNGLYRKILIQDEIDFDAVWSWISDIELDDDAFTISEDSDGCRILPNKKVNSAGSIITIQLSDGENIRGAIELEVTE